MHSRLSSQLNFDHFIGGGVVRRDCGWRPRYLQLTQRQQTLHSFRESTAADVTTYLGTH